jgi:hypothetical protein
MRRANRRGTAPILGLAILLAASCGGRELTRPDAKRLLDADAHFTPAKSVLHRLMIEAYGRKYCDSPPGDNFPRSVDAITGITTPASAQNQRIVEFRWSWKVAYLSPERAKCLSLPGPNQATAVFQLYDDGWRVIEVTCPRGADCWPPS